MKKGILFLVLLAAALVAAPAVSSALTITVYDAYREVDAYASMDNDVHVYFTDDSLDGTMWSRGAGVHETQKVCTAGYYMDICLGDLIIRDAYASASQESGWDLAADGSSLSVDVYQYSHVEISDTVEVQPWIPDPYEGEAAISNYFGIGFYTDEAAGYSLTLDILDAWGNALIQLYNLDSASYVFDYESSQYGQVTGALPAGTYFLEVYSDYNSYSGPYNIGGMNLGFVVGDAGGGTEPVAVPEPGTLLLLGTGITGLVLLRKRLAK